MTEEDALKILEIKKGSSIEEISQAFRKVAQKTHPDKGGNVQDFIKAKQAKEKLTTIAIVNGTPVSEDLFVEKQDVKNVIVVDDAFYLMNHEDEFRDWRKPNPKIMGHLSVKNHNQYTEMVVDFCNSGSGGSYQSIEDYLRNVVGITSPYKMNERIVSLRRTIQQFRKNNEAK